MNLTLHCFPAFLTLHRFLALRCFLPWSALASAPTMAADIAPGKQVFERYCAQCHAPGVGHPGTQQLGWTRGESLSLLEKRTDLQPAYIRLVVRNGLLEMPPFRPTEINEAQLEQLAAYLAKSGRR